MPSALSPSDVKLAEQMRHLLATLTPREEEILRMRFGIGGDKHTLREVGQKVGLTRERVRQIAFQALRKLRARLPALHE